MKLGRLNHIGVATPSIAESIKLYRDVLGATIELGVAIGVVGLLL